MIVSHGVRRHRFSHLGLSPLHTRACAYSYGNGPAVRPQTRDTDWSLVISLWRTIAPFARPWCDEGKGLSAASVNLHGDSQSRIRWHRDDEPLFGASVKSKLIVSLSTGASALSRWKRHRSCALCVEDGMLLSFDLLVVDGSAQDELLHHTDPDLERNVPTDQTTWSRFAHFRPLWHIVYPRAAKGHQFSKSLVWRVKECYGYFW